VLAVIAPLGFLWPGALGLLVVLDLLWLAALFVDLLRTPSPAEVAVQRESPPAFSAGRAVPVTYRWRSGRAATTIEVRERLPDPLDDGAPVRRLAIPGGGEFVEEHSIHPRHRGRADGGILTIRRLGPLGLAWRQASRPAGWSAVVYPSLAGASTRALPASARRREAGRRAIRRAGEGRLFETLREWVPGDDTRIIDWKATARRGKPIARQYEDERRQQVLIVVDAGRLLTAEVGGVARLEAAIAAALHLAHAAAEQDDDVGVMIFADEVQQYVPPARGRRALRNVVEALATAEGRLAESDYPAAFRYLAARGRKRALTVLFTDLIDRTASEALVAQAATLRPRHLPLAVTLRDPSLEAAASDRPATGAAAFERAAAEELLRARDEALAEMRARGVNVLDVAPAAAARSVVEQYHALKRRGVL
jgi:uncharacterized protein (DUF58 family)